MSEDPAAADGAIATDPDPEGVPDFAAAAEHVRESLVRFVRSLRRAGVETPANAATEAGRALVVAGFAEDDARAALRATLVSRRADLPVFERQFPEFWRRLRAGLDGAAADRPGDAPDGGLAPTGDPDDRTGGEADGGDGDGAAPDPAGEGGVALSRVAAEALSGGDDDAREGSAYSRSGSRTTVSVPRPALRVGGGDLAGPVRDLTRALSALDGRRFARGDGPAVDARRALRESVAAGGAVVEVPRRERRETGVRALALVDVSRSVLEAVDRAFLLRFLHRARAEWRDLRVLFFDEGVREVTDAFEGPTTADAVDALERAEAEWGGGTRIGDAVTAVVDRYPDAVDRDTVVLVVSDGLEVGAVEGLEAGMARLSRTARATLWLNPLAASPDYEPTARGMAAALPYVGGLFAFAGPEDVAELARQLRLRGAGGAVGYEYDPRRGPGRGDDRGEADATTDRADSGTDRADTTTESEIT